MLKTRKAILNAVIEREREREILTRRNNECEKLAGDVRW